MVSFGKCRHKRWTRGGDERRGEGGETRRDVSFGEMAGQDGRNKMRIVFLPSLLPSVLNGDCQPWSFLTPPPSPRVQSRQPKKITPGELSSSSLSLSRVVDMTLFLFLFFFLLLYPSREAPLGGRGGGDGGRRRRREGDFKGGSAAHSLYLSLACPPLPLAVVPTGARFAGLASLHRGGAMAAAAVMAAKPTFYFYRSSPR